MPGGIMLCPTQVLIMPHRPRAHEDGRNCEPNDNPLVSNQSSRLCFRVHLRRCLQCHNTYVIVNRLASSVEHLKFGIGAGGPTRTIREEDERKSLE